MSLKVLRKEPFIYTVGLGDGKSLLIENLCVSLGIHYVRLMERDRHRKIQEITSNIENGVMPLEADFVLEGTQMAGEGNPEILLFSNLTENKLDEFLSAYKTAGIEPVSLKAVVTPTNVTWTIEELTGELIKERAAMLFGKNR